MKHSKAILLSLVIFFIVMISFFGYKKYTGLNVIKVDGLSMYPNLKNGEKVYAFKHVPFEKSSNHRGEVVVFDANSVDPRNSNGNAKKYYVKRIIGVPGDKVNFDGKNIYLNGKLIKQNFISKEQKESGSQTIPQIYGDYKVLKTWDLKTLSNRNYNGEYYWNSYSKNTEKVPSGMYFVMGDNRDISNDSRQFGYVKEKDLIGYVKTSEYNNFGLKSSDKYNSFINDIRIK